MISTTKNENEIAIVIINRAFELRLNAIVDPRCLSKDVGMGWLNEMTVVESWK